MLGRDELYNLLNRGMRERDALAIQLAEQHASSLGFLDLAWLAEGWRLLEEGKARQAEHALRRAHEVDPISLVILDLLAQALLQDGRPTEAMKLWALVMLRGNETARCLALSRRAEVHAQRGDSQRALASLRLALSFDDSQTAVWLQLLRHLISEDDLDAAQRAVQEAATRVRSQEARSRVAAMLHEAGSRADQANSGGWLRLAVIMSAEPPPRVETTEDSWRAYAQLASAAAAEGHTELAAARLSTALVLAHRDAHPRVLEEFASGRTREEIEKTVGALERQHLPTDVREHVRGIVAESASRS